MAIRRFCRAAPIAAALALAGCGAERDRADRGQRDRRRRRGSPIPISQPLDPPSAFLTEAIAQGLVRFDAAGEIEPALAQSWIVSDDGLRYTFRIRRAHWADGSPVTAQQVAARLRAALSRASRNPLKPVLGAVDDDRADDRLRARDQPARAAPQFPAAARPARAGDRPERCRHRALPAGERPRPAASRLVLIRGRGRGGPRRERPPDILLRGERGGGARSPASPPARRSSSSAAPPATCRSRAPPICRPTGWSSIRSAACSASPSPAAAGRSPTPALRRALAMAIDRDGARPRRSARRASPARTSLVAPGVQELPAPLCPTGPPCRSPSAARSPRALIARARARGADPPQRGDAGRPGLPARSSPICAATGG